MSQSRCVSHQFQANRMYVAVTLAANGDPMNKHKVERSYVSWSKKGPSFGFCNIMLHGA